VGSGSWRLFRLALEVIDDEHARKRLRKIELGEKSH